MALVRNHQHLATFLGFGNDLVSVIYRTNHGLLTQHVQSLVERGHDLLKVQRMRRRNLNCIHLNAVQHLFVIDKARQIRHVLIAFTCGL